MVPFKLRFKKILDAYSINNLCNSSDTASVFNTNTMI